LRTKLTFELLQKHRLNFLEPSHDRWARSSEKIAERDLDFGA
jgi:hypothetical protein